MSAFPCKGGNPLLALEDCSCQRYVGSMEISDPFLSTKSFLGLRCRHSDRLLNRARNPKTIVSGSHSNSTADQGLSLTPHHFHPFADVVLVSWPGLLKAPRLVDESQMCNEGQDLLFLAPQWSCLSREQSQRDFGSGGIIVFTGRVDMRRWTISHHHGSFPDT